MHASFANLIQGVTGACESYFKEVAFLRAKALVIREIFSSLALLKALSIISDDFRFLDLSR